VVWLCEGLAQALEARGVAIVLRRGQIYVEQARYGVLTQPLHAELESTIERAAAQRSLVTARGGSLGALIGADQPFGAVWVEHEAPLDTELTPLLLAVIDTGAMALEATLQRPQFALEHARHAAPHLR
jgi:hypothetical protein